ncbi:Gfo/Idh/MocA family protein [Domibacillus indicus]|uniref:Gfo/Idh/MocA family protein n=1 Tax=Domibacillus indicus TaxID=1437523 RepID=UPI000617DEA7|nr:Gfo/Idh/MocA family oxidoreductase [Domibacillus indicus]
MESLRVIQAGAGGFGLSWLEIIKSLDFLDIVAVVDIEQTNRDRAKKLLGDEGIHYFDNHLQAFQSTEADIALIITPPQTHKTLSIDALKNGLHVFLEKPIAQTLQDAKELHQAAKGYSQHVMISQNYRWRPEIQAIKKAVDDQIAGPIEYVEWNFRRATNFGGWRDQYKEIVIEDMSIHHFDLMRYILGKDASTVYAKSMRPSWSWFQGNPTASVTMSFEEVLVHYFASWVTTGPETSWNGEIKLYGKNGLIELSGDRPYVTAGDGAKRPLPLVDMAYTDREFSIYEMVSAIQENRRPATDLEDNLKSFGIVGAALESVKLSHEIKVADILSEKESVK